MSVGEIIVAGYGVLFVAGWIVTVVRRAWKEGSRR